jgi:hypothetical protein
LPRRSLGEGGRLQKFPNFPRKRSKNFTQYPVNGQKWDSAHQESTKKENKMRLKNGIVKNRTFLISLIVPIVMTAATAQALDPTVAPYSIPNVTTAGGTSYSFTVHYSDDGEVDVGSFDNNDIRVTGPGGFNVAATFVSYSGGGGSVNATYSIIPPGGSWDAADNGTYTVVMQANQVFDGLGNPVHSGNIGSFQVTVSNPSPTPTPTPAVTTNPVTSIASFSATLNGSLNPRGSTTTVYFQYGLTTSYGSTTPMQTQTGTTVRSISANISSLSASTVYHFRIVAHNGGGTSFGSDRTFTTLSPTGLPVVTTNPATLIASFSATLNGSVDPHGLASSIHFQYGTTTSYGLTTAPQSQAGNMYRNVSTNISSLMASTTYHFRIVATNSAGTTFGSDRTFTTLSATGPPVVTTNPATLIASFSATLNGSVDSHGLATSIHFQYGTTTSYGLTTAPQSKTGNTFQSVSANITGLMASTTYHFRIAVTNSAGTTSGSDRTFTTLIATGPPVVTTSAATNIATSSATLNGSLDPHGLTTSVSFQYGTTTSYGHTTPMQSQTRNTYRNIAANISGLTTHTTYHFRIVATNSGGTRFGSDRTFTTP